jgi:integrase
MAKKRGNNEGSITRRSDGRWMAQVTIGRDSKTGKPKRATFYGKTRQEVAEKLTKALRERQQGTFVAPHKLTLGEWLDTWLWEYKQPTLRPLSFDHYETVIRRYLKPALGHIPLQDLRPEQVQSYYNEQVQYGFEASTLRHHHVALSQALALAETHALVARNVARQAAPPRLTHKERHTLTVDEVTTRLLPALKSHRLYAAFLVFFTTGLRRGEVAGLRWQDIDGQAAVLHIRQALVRTKNHAIGRTELVKQEPKTAYSRRTIPLLDICQAALRHHRAQQAEEKLQLGPGYTDQGLVFCRANGAPIDPGTLDRVFRLALKRAGVPAIRLHDARHTFATWMLEQGVSPKVVQTMLGHSSIKITMDLYSHVSLDLERQAAATLNAALTRGLQ